MLYFSALFSFMSCCIVLYHTTLGCILLDCVAFLCTVMHWLTSYRTVLSCIKQVLSKITANECKNKCTCKCLHRGVLQSKSVYPSSHVHMSGPIQDPGWNAEFSVSLLGNVFFIACIKYVKYMFTYFFILHFAYCKV